MQLVSNRMVIKNTSLLYFTEYTKMGENVKNCFDLMWSAQLDVPWN